MLLRHYWSRARRRAHCRGSSASFATRPSAEFASVISNRDLVTVPLVCRPQRSVPTTLDAGPSAGAGFGFGDHAFADWSQTRKAMGIQQVIPTPRCS